ncbi:MAG: GSCFA domain-containing protein [Chitinophagaceae bacterium]|nr:GSCFA domain-containing protein [Chitinophagaceae bacterium]MBK8951473.1 GSCFA domain-containing protein [Chitinophagaceae bacterium]
MDFMLNIDLKKLCEPIKYGDKIMLVGSCFTEHIGNALGDLKFDTLQNPNGILFGPDSVCKSLLSYVDNKQYQADELFYLNEVWNSWNHHSRFSYIDKEKCLDAINASQKKAHEFLMQADWLIITLGSSFTYRLTQYADTAKAPPAEELGEAVANCHRAPAAWFSKDLLAIDEIKDMLESSLKKLKAFNPKLKFIFTVSPVRHIRDGVVENNRSKARLIDAVHFICTKFESAFYFPAYELVIDVLRDYRFYDIDLVHPNYAATEFVLDKFALTCIDEPSQQLMQEVKKIVIARKHKPFQPETEAHSKFLHSYAVKAKEIILKYPFIDFKEELQYFSNGK